ncbi:hypothetical protein D3C73_1240320 [compost metagenome]
MVKASETVESRWWGGNLVVMWESGGGKGKCAVIIRTAYIQSYSLSHSFKEYAGVQCRSHHKKTPLSNGAMNYHCG